MNYLTKYSLALSHYNWLVANGGGQWRTERWRSVAHGGHRRVAEETTFFFRNFPDGCSSEMLRSRFEEIGSVTEVFVPTKKDKQGNNFGFVRFARNSIVHDILEKLNKVWIGSYIIRAYPPKFDRSVKTKSGKRSTCREPVRAMVWASEMLNKGWRERGVSYADKVRGQGRCKIKARQEVAGDGDMDEEVSFQSTEEESKWLREAFTGRLKGEFTWVDHGEEILSECDMGSGMLLLQSGSEKTTNEVINGLDEWSRFWMDWCKPWAYVDVNWSREVWTRWTGVPLQAWSSRFFGVVISRIGTMVGLHEYTRCKQRLDEAYVKISTGLQSCDRVVSCKIDGAQFKIKIEEIRCTHMIGFLGQGGAPESISTSESDSLSSDVDKWIGGHSVVAALEGWSESEREEGESVHGGAGTIRISRSNGLEEGTFPSENKKSAEGAVIMIEICMRVRRVLGRAENKWRIN